MPGKSARRTSVSNRRSSREWTVRLAVAGIALAAGYVSGAQSLAYAIRAQAPERANRLAPWDGRITAAIAAKDTTVAEPSPAQLERAEQFAKKALSGEPLAVPAVASLAIANQFRGNTEAARRLFAYSDRLSRRDLRTRLWAIEDAVSREDIPGALRNYDMALRTSRRAPEILFPILSAAVSDPEIARGLLSLLETNPPWGESFVAQLAGSDVEPLAIAQFYDMASAQGLAVRPSAEAALVNKLVASGAYERAWAYYRNTRRDVDARRSRNPDFAETIESPSLFDWNAVAAVPGVNASLQSGQAGGVLDFSAPATVGALVAQQYQLLPPGRYRLEGRSVGVDQSPNASPYWSLECIDGREMGRIDLPNSSEANGRFAGEFRVDTGCPAQILKLNLRPSNKIGGVSGQIDRAALQPI